MKNFQKDKKGISNIIVVALSLVVILAITTDVILWNYEMNQLDWEKMREEIELINAETINQIATYNSQEYAPLQGTNFVSGNISNLILDDENYMKFQSYYSGTNIHDFVDNNNSNIDSIVDKGSHSNFTAQQYGPDLITDNLIEENTAGNNLTFLYANSYDGFRTDWTRVGNSPYLSGIDYNSNYIYTNKNNYKIGDFGFEDSGLSSETIQNVTIQLYTKQTTANNPIQLFVWDGSSWYSLGLSTPTTSWTWLNYTATIRLDSWIKINSAKIYIQTATASGLYEVDCARLMIDYILPENYEIDLEIQWTNIDFNQSNEFLCIHGGTTGQENIRVDIWNGINWENIMPELNTGWNNVSISSYLTHPTLTIRFNDENKIDDSSQDTWQLEVSVIHVWTDQYTSEVEFFGSSNSYNWTWLNWTMDSSWTEESIQVTIQVYDFTLDDYPTSGDGFFTYSSSIIPNIDENKYGLIQDNPINFRNQFDCLF